MKKIILEIILFFLSVCSFSETYSVFFRDSKCGLINEKRQIVMPAEYLDISINEDGYVICETGNKAYEFYSNKLNLIYTSPSDWNYLRIISKDEYIVPKRDENNKFLYEQIFNVKTKELKPYKRNKNFLWEQYYSDGLVVNISDKYDDIFFRIFDKNENVIVDNISQADYCFSEGLLAVILEDGKSGYMDTKGKLVINVPLYKDLRNSGPKIEPLLNYPFCDGVALIQIEKDKWAIVDKKNSIKAVPDSYKLITKRFSNGLTVVCDSNYRYGYMNKNASIAIPCEFDKASNFIGKYAAVKYNGKDAVIDSDGNIYFCDTL